MKKIITFASILLLFALPAYALGPAFMSPGIQPETATWSRLAKPTPAAQKAVNDYIKAIKYTTAGITLASLTLNTSNVASYYFFSNPSVDLRPYSGFYGTFNDGAKLKKVLFGAVGTGETNTDIMTNSTDWSGGPPPTGWGSTPAGALSTVGGGESGNALQITENGTANPFAAQVCAVTAGRLYNFGFSIKSGTSSVYKAYMAVSTVWDANVGRGTNTASTGSWVSQAFYKTAIGTGTSTAIFMTIAGAGSGLTHLFDTGYFRSVLTPSSTGIWFTHVSEEAGWNPNAATQTLTITRN